MSQAEELLNSLSPNDTSLYSSDPKIEEHIIINEDRYIKVPESLKRIAVQHDHNVETVTFDCPRYWDGHDLTELYVWINYIRKDEVMGRYLAKNVRINEDDSNLIHFEWTIGNEITEINGPIVFLVCALKTDSDGMEEIHWNSEKCKDMFISEGMDCADKLMNEYPDIITDLLTRMDAILVANGTILDTSLTQTGLAADARATGEAINKVDNKITEIIEGSEYTPIKGNPIHIKEASKNKCKIIPIGVIDQETREGYNLYDYSNGIVSNASGLTIEYDIKTGYITVNGTAGKTYIGVSTSIDITDILEDGETYTIKQEQYSATANGGVYVQVVETRSDGTNNHIEASDTFKQFKANKAAGNTYTIMVQTGATIETFNNYKNRYMLYKGTDDKPFEQFGVMPSINFPSDTKGISGASEIYHTGKNTFKPSLTTDDGYTINQTRCTVTLNKDEFTFKATDKDMYFGEVAAAGKPYGRIYDNNSAYPGELYKAKPGECIAITFTNPEFDKIYITTYDKNKISLGYKLVKVGDPYKLPDNAEYYIIRFGKNASVSGTTYKTKIQVEILNNISDSPTDYSEPQNETIKLTLPKGMELFEGESIFNEEGKWYRDKIFAKDVVDGVNKKFIAKSTTESNKLFFTNILNTNILAPSDNNEILKHYSNYFKGDYSINSLHTRDLKGSAIRNDKIFGFGFGLDSDLDTLEKANQWLIDKNTEGNPLYVVAPLAQPTKEEITDATLLDQLNTLSKLKTYKGVNNFFLTSDGADGLIELEYKKFAIVGQEDTQELEEQIINNKTNIETLQTDLETLKTDIEEEVNATLEEVNATLEEVTENLELKTVYNDFVVTSTETKHTGNDYVVSTSSRNVDLYATITKEGYYPIALVGVRGVDADEKYDFRHGHLSNQTKGSCVAHWYFTNASGQSINASNVPKCVVTILWVKIK